MILYHIHRRESGQSFVATLESPTVGLTHFSFNAGWCSGFAKFFLTVEKHQKLNSLDIGWAPSCLDGARLAMCFWKMSKLCGSGAVISPAYHHGLI
jgi:hypothetical protein